MKILIIGGHMAPAIALVQQIPKEWEIVYVGRRHVFEGDKGTSLEYETVRSLGIRFLPFSAGRMQRSLTGHTLGSLLKVPGSLFKAIMLVRKEKPDVVVGFGGYMSVPLGMAAFLLRIPLVIHEQTLSAGLANKLLSRFATKICISWSSSKKFFPLAKTVVTGNPVLQPGKQNEKLTFPKGKEPLVVVVGGSGGSHAINIRIEEILPSLLEKYRVFHQTGDAQEFGDFDRLSKLRSSLQNHLQEKYVITKFISPFAMESILKKADLVIGRSGINTITLLLALGRQALLIPLPYGQKNEQLDNALFLQRKGIAVVINQNQATASTLLKEIPAMIKKPLFLSDSEKEDTTHAIERIIDQIHQCLLVQSKKENSEASLAK